jgi:hypothetical protein
VRRVRDQAAREIGTMFPNQAPVEASNRRTNGES